MLDRILALVVEVKPGERRALFWSFAYFFLLISTYWNLQASSMREPTSIFTYTRFR